MNDFTVDPSALQATSSAFQAHAAELRQIYDKLVSDLDAAGSPWHSATIDKTYQPAKDNALAAFRKDIHGVTSVADALSQWGTNYTNAGQADLQSVHTLLP